MNKINKKGNKFIVFLVLISLILLFITCGDQDGETSEPQGPSKPSNNTYTVIYDKNAYDATGTMENSTFTVGVSGNLSKNSFVRDNCIFLGWITVIANKGFEYKDGQSIRDLTTAGKTITLFAMWQVHYTVIYNKNSDDATGIMENSIYINDIGNLSINNFVRDNYCFLGWAKTAASTTAEYTDGQILNATDFFDSGRTRTLYAVWHEAYTVKVTEGNTLSEKFTWIDNNAESYTTYIIEINSDNNYYGKSLKYDNKNCITIHLKGNGSIKSLSGSLFEINRGVTLILDEKIILSSIYSSNNYLIKVLDGHLIMNGGKISNIQSISRELVYVQGIFIMNGGEITGNYSSSGVHVDNNGIFTMNGGEISDNSSSGVRVDNGIFTMNGGEISGNSSSGVGVLSEGIFTMNGGEISDNTSYDYGGGVVSGGTFTMNDGVIYGNTARGGGGIYIRFSAIFTMNGGEISSNFTDGFGGGVYADMGGTFTMNGGEISANTALSGGGVYMSQSFTQQLIFNKIGGTITGFNSINGNVVKDNNKGSAVYLYANRYERRKETTAGPGDNLSFSFYSFNNIWTNDEAGTWDF